MRVFLAINVGHENELSAISSQIAHKGVKLVDHYHITLAFFGDLSTAELINLKFLLDKLHHPSFTLTTSNHIDCFSNWNRLRVLFLPVEYHKLLNQLALKIQNLCRDVFDLPNSFEPHITLGRVKFPIVDEAYISAMQQLRCEPISWKVTELVLYESTLLPKGAEYKRIGSVKLD